MPLLHVKWIEREALAHQIRDGVRRSGCWMSWVESTGVGDTRSECGPVSLVPRLNQGTHLWRRGPRPAVVRLGGGRETRLG